MEEMQGTPITRSGGYMMRAGWRAVGYSVDAGTETKFKIACTVLWLLVAALGVVISMFLLDIFYTYIAPKVSPHIPAIKNYPAIWQYLTYSGVFFVCYFVYLFLRTQLSNFFVKGCPVLDEGSSFLTQRRESAVEHWKTRFSLIVMFFAGAYFTAQLGTGFQLFLASLAAYQLVETMFFKFIYRPKA